ncbi:hypothetical protein LINPERHAP2_LOCUS33039 [Linum perenne]
MDMGFVGQRFTWTNFHKDNENIKERLDRSLCNQAWTRNFEEAQLFHELIIRSDHCPLCLDLTSRRKKGNTPFRFDRR